MKRPLLTFALFSYNHERFIKHAVKGALSQTYSPLEIIISDDFSKDRSFAGIQQEVTNYNGSHRIRLNQNQRNLGIADHINRVMEFAKGELIIVAAGDDISFPERVAEIYSAFMETKGKAASLFSDTIVIDDEGSHHGLLRGTPIQETELTLRYMVHNMRTPVYGCSHAWRRDVFEEFGPILHHVISEDYVIPIRSALIGEIKYIEKPLVLYRRGANNISRRPDDLSGTHALYSNRKRWAMNYSGVYRNWLADMDTMVKICPKREEELRRLKKTIIRHLEILDKEIALYNCGYRSRISIIRKSISQNVNTKRILLWILMFVFPELYLRYQRLKRGRLSKRPKKSTS